MKNKSIFRKTLVITGGVIIGIFIIAVICFVLATVITLGAMFIGILDGFWSNVWKIAIVLFVLDLLYNQIIKLAKSKYEKKYY